MEGQLIAHYKVLRKVGGGGMGVITADAVKLKVIAGIKRLQFLAGR